MTATLIGISGIIAAIILRDVTTTAADSAGILYGNVLGKLVQVVIIIVTILIGIDQIGIDVSLLKNIIIIVFSALLFSAAVAFGFGAKTSVSNILASYYLQKIYRIGDKIKVSELEGTIVEITPFGVILDSAEGQVYIPAREFNQQSSILLSRD